MNEPTLNFRNYRDLVRDTMKLAPALRDVDAIVGVPRSGMLPATILATALHKPLAAPPTGTYDLVVAAGARVRKVLGPVERVAVVDDSVWTGAAIERATAPVIDALPGSAEVLRACVYMHPDAHEHVDHWAVDVPGPRVFEWNLFGSEMIRHSMIDIDGVLCPDPPMNEDDRAAYVEYILDAPLLHKPLFPVAALATNRIQFYRAETEEWLAKNGIEYGELVMAPFESAAARRRMSNPIELKAAWYLDHARTHPGIFIESHDRIAQGIAQIVGRPVVSCQSMEVFG